MPELPEDAVPNQAKVQHRLDELGADSSQPTETTWAQGKPLAGQCEQSPRPDPSDNSTTSSCRESIIAGPPSAGETGCPFTTATTYQVVPGWSMFCWFSPRTVATACS